VVVANVSFCFRGFSRLFCLLTWTDRPRIPLFFKMTLHPWMKGSWRFEAKQCLILKCRNVQGDISEDTAYFDPWRYGRKATKQLNTHYHITRNSTHNLLKLYTLHGVLFKTCILLALPVVVPVVLCLTLLYNDRGSSKFTVGFRMLYVYIRV